MVSCAAVLDEGKVVALLDDGGHVDADEAFLHDVVCGHLLVELVCGFVPALEVSYACVCVIIVYRSM